MNKARQILALANIYLIRSSKTETMKYTLLILIVLLLLGCQKAGEPMPFINLSTDIEAAIVINEGGKIDITYSIESTDSIASLTASVNGSNPDSYVIWNANCCLNSPAFDPTSISDTATISWLDLLSLGGMSTSYTSVFTATDIHGNQDSFTTTITVIEDALFSYYNANLTHDTNWEGVVVVDGTVTVEAGATLTIQPGTIVKMTLGRSSLIIAPGAKIEAQGTSDSPIIFTSEADEIALEDMAAGNFKSPNLATDLFGLWGGLYILGKAHISDDSDQGTDTVEGLLSNSPS